MREDTNRNVRKINTLLSFSIFILFCCFTVGFALYGQILNFGGDVSFNAPGKLAIVGVELVDGNHVKDGSVPTFTEDSVDFHLSFYKDDLSDTSSYMATYKITINNDTFYDYNIATMQFQPVITNSSGNEVDASELTYTVNGVNEDSVIKAGSSSEFEFIITFAPSNDTGSYDIEGSTSPETEVLEIGSLLASIPSNLTLDLRGEGTIVPLDVSVLSTYKTEKSYSLKVNNTSHFVVVDASGNPINELTINPESDETVRVYIKVANGAIFLEETEDSGFTLVSAFGNVNCGNITFLVDKQEEYIDETPPTVSNLSYVINNQTGSVTLSWNGEDDVAISNYTILVYNNNNTLVSTYHTVGDETTYNITDLAAGNYYFKVYGTDTSDNTASTTEINNATTGSGVCVRTETAEFRWSFTVTANITNGSSSNNNNVQRGATYTTTLSGDNNGNPPQTVTITMGGTQLANNQYTYTANNGSLSVPNVTGNLVITGTATRGGICLVEGTKVLMADGKYKNIEDITYDDLLNVWSYDTGSLMAEYPIWIEITNTKDSYQLTTFSDGSTLKTVGFHGVFSSDLNMFVSVDDPENFKVGTNIYKVVNGKLKSVSVKSIEYINEKINYYHVVSTRYYNIIANDFLTTDGTVILSNLYGFDKNVTWPKLKDSVTSDKNNLYDYSEMSYMPEYMFRGLRAAEGKFLNNLGYLPKEMFDYYLMNNQLNENMLLQPKTDKNGNRSWMVTIEGKKVHWYNKNSFKKIEGSTYTLPINNKVKCYRSSFDYKCYKPGDKYKVYGPTHFTIEK